VLTLCEIKKRNDRSLEDGVRVLARHSEEEAAEKKPS
jgi:hypothetical protein